MKIKSELSKYDNLVAMRYENSELRHFQDYKSTYMEHRQHRQQQTYVQSYTRNQAFVQLAYQ